MEKRVNKILFIIVGCWIFGLFGVDRFMRGQVGLGILKIFFGWAVWALVDLIIALTKIGDYGDEFVFINGSWAPK